MTVIHRRRGSSKWIEYLFSHIEAGHLQRIRDAFAMLRTHLALRTRCISFATHLPYLTCPIVKSVKVEKINQSIFCVSILWETFSESNLSFDWIL